MSAPKEFQLRTIDRVLSAFDARRSVRRFLVADEVGLGKTVVARGVIEKMLNKRRHSSEPLRVIYMCNSMSIAAQNRNSLLKALPANANYGKSLCRVDRLTLVFTEKLHSDSPMHLFTLSPNTSIPDRKGRTKTGTAKERALIHNLIASAYPTLVEHKSHEWLQQRAQSRWEDWKAHAAAQINPTLVKQFLSALRKELNITKSQPLPLHLRRQIESRGEKEVIKLLRVALAKANLNRLRPDLVILDEFQRYRDIVDHETASDISRALLSPGYDGPSVLLLSATPYRMSSGENTNFGDSGFDHHSDFFKLLEWLFGGRKLAKEKIENLTGLFASYRESLLSEEPFSSKTLAIKKCIEDYLRPVVARTERLISKSNQPKLLKAAVDRHDLRVFKDLVHCFTNIKKGRYNGVAVPYWSSVPLPIQLLGPEYIAWKSWSTSSSKAIPRQTSAPLTRAKRNRFRAPIRWPHHKLRAFKEYLNVESLSLPFIAPSMPWWPLDKNWVNPVLKKALVFSRFRAVPRAIAGLLSYDVERRLLSNGNRDYVQVSDRNLIGVSRENLAFFHPSAVLSRMVDPWRFEVARAEDVIGKASLELQASLESIGVSVVRYRKGHRARKVPELLLRLERTADQWQKSMDSWFQIASELDPANSANVVTGVREVTRAVLEWDQAVEGHLDEITLSEVRQLAKLAVASPGAVIARSLERHNPRFLDDANSLADAVRLSWGAFRGYFNNSWMDISPGLRRSKTSHRDRIEWAILHGNLESVLDEHLWISRAVRHHASSELVHELRNAVSLRTSLVGVQNHPLRRFNLRTHSVFAFTAGNTNESTIEQHTSKVRTEDIRVSFNSPFWPFVVASTSVGQEGLDFHSWCHTVVHWDLPANAVDLEQREGRVDRYAGLATRLATVAKYRPNRDEVARGHSPWDALAEKADNGTTPDKNKGLSPWWVFDGAEIDRIIFDVPTSESQIRFKKLTAQRLLYRLALGQPNQTDFLRALSKRITDTENVHQQIRNVTINLGEV